MDRKRSVGQGAALLVVLGLTGALVGAMPAAAAGDGTARDAATPAATLEWGTCPDDVEDPQALSQCATVPVPLDYGDPDGERIEIMISRLPSFNP
ncbi:outer membrane lipoprotein SlyB, partial [Actinoalloteichus hoggarensis]|nr:outer membrane lipoprotein SlyB [Actinoalloteichus hoggarensis]